MRQKTNVSAPTVEEAQEHMKNYTEASSTLKKIEGEIELKVQAVRDKYKTTIESMTKTKEESFQKLSAFAIQNRDELFSKKKSLEWVHGILGFRTGTPKVNKKSGITWAAMLDLFKSQKLKAFIRTKEEIDKDKIIQSREDEKVMKQLAGMGIKVIQDETFYVEPKEEKISA